MRRKISWIIGALSVSLLSAWLVACSGSGNSGTWIGGSNLQVAYNGETGQWKIDVASVQDTLTTLYDFVPMCSKDNDDISGAVLTSTEVSEGVRLLHEIPPASQILADAVVQPKDIAGPCGGILSYKNWNHSDGNTSGILSFEEYCFTDNEDSKVILDGDISFFTDGTPSDDGPVINSLSADSPLFKVTKEKNGASEEIELGFEGFVYTPGTEVTSEENNSYSIKTLVINNKSTNKSSMITDVIVDLTWFDETDETETSMTGKFYVGDYGYVDITTLAPITVDDSNNFKSGTLKLTGKDSTSAELNIVPGDYLKFTVAVNGEPITDTFSCVSTLDD